ncbi:hypothetical protein BCR34DRAFT_588801 [Clohesyomyces aquaticus]|uniref:Uncharacterized protein n=1 Tax=Clohesyomyces aquaticus TaxID=1231657 RepID=A0A1Y1ZIY8_9PLEO|nr:hypothetical protein BCR34DRAFT_588801 [Clohesyomyces aquaticus]
MTATTAIDPKMDTSATTKSPDAISETIKMPTTNASSLLRLPGEIRNRIYASALTAPSGLTYRSSISTGKFYFCESDPTSGGSEYNQLKYTCRQLYAETASLESRVNVIIFNQSCPNPTPPIAQFQELAGAIMATKSFGFVE